MFGFCMARVTTCVMRIVWATRPKHIPIAIAAQIFVAAGVVLLFVVNLIFTQRIIRAAHPHGGWHPFFAWFFRGIYILIIITLIMLITGNVQSFYTLNKNTKRIDRDIILYGQTFYTIISFLPFPMVIIGLVIPRKTRVEKFGIGHFRTKIIVLLSAAFLLCLGAAFRVGTNYKTPRPISEHPKYFNKACFYIFNFTVEYIVIVLYVIVRVDLRFHVPNGAKQAGDYSGINAMRNKEVDIASNSGKVSNGERLSNVESKRNSVRESIIGKFPKAARIMSEEEVFDDVSEPPMHESWTPATGSSHELQVSENAGIQRGQLFGISVGGTESRRGTYYESQLV